jgi:WD40 repeat protein
LTAWDKSLFLIDLQTFEIVKEISLPEKSFVIFKLNPNLILIGGEKCLTQVFVDVSTNSLKILNKWMAHEDQINDICIFPSQSLLITGSNDGSLMFWNFDNLYENLSVVGKIFPFTNENGSTINKIILHPTKNSILVVNNTCSISQFFIDFVNWKITECSHNSGFKSKISTINYLPAKQLLLASYHSSNELYQINVHQ